jgi:predicted regulator of Ras-like GTPase activity (Roadblock/LC7/MglB family)
LWVQVAAVEAALARLEKKKGVEGVLAVSRDGRVVRSTVPDALGAQYALLLARLVEQARSIVAALDPQVTAVVA